MAMSGKVGRPSSASPAQAPAPWWRGSRRRCGWWPSRSWSRRKSNPWTKEEVHLTRKMMIGEMMRTRSRIAIPSACCWFAVFNSLSTVSLYKRENHNKLIPFSKLTRDVFSVLSKRSSASQCSQRWPRSTEKEGYVWMGVDRGFLLGTHHGSFSASWNMERFMEHESHHGTCHGLHHRPSSHHETSGTHLKSFVCIRILLLLIQHVFSKRRKWQKSIWFVLNVLPASFYQREICFSLYLFVVFPNL